MSTYDHTTSVLDEVPNERIRQDRKWGEQNHPDGTGPSASLADYDALDLHSAIEGDTGIAGWARERCEAMFANGNGTYEAILTEEWAEALDCDDPADLRAELIQVAAVAVAWVEKIDREATAKAVL